MGDECQPADYCAGVIMQNFIIKGRDNPVIIEFSFSDGFSLAMFNNIEFKLGAETYSTQTHPDKIEISGNALTLSIGDTTALAAGKYLPTIIGYSAEYDDGYVLTGEKNPVLQIMIDVRDDL